MGEPDVAGADLSGRGPALLLIGDESYDELADLLMADYTVIRCDAPLAQDALVADDASAVDKALALVDAVAGGGAAYVFGSGLGAVVGLELIARYPGLVRLLVAHEPSDRLGGGDAGGVGGSRGQGGAGGWSRVCAHGRDG